MPVPHLVALHVEYAGGRVKYGLLFRFSLFYEYSNLEYAHFHVIYKVDQAEYGIRILVDASQEYVNTYSTCRTGRWGGYNSDSCHQARAALELRVNPNPQVTERISVSSSDGDHQRCILDLPMKPGTIRNQ